MSPKPTSIQILDAALWTEIGAERSPEPEEAFHALASLLSRWLLARAEYPELESLRLFAKIRANVANPEQFLDNQGIDI
ncbi:MAG: hypothetical protein QOH31_3551 [Verrucomicrobiota bacterium]|jgi:hypothetical protein